MLKTKFELARELVEDYNNAYLQGDTFDHIQEWLDERIKNQKKYPNITIDDEGHVTDVEKWEVTRCDCCGAEVKYMKTYFSKQFVFLLQKILDHVINLEDFTWEYTNIVHIRDLSLTHAEYTIINKIANFGLLYREKTEDGRKIKFGKYGVPRKRIYDFLNGDWEVARFYVTKSTTKERTLSKERVTVDMVHMDEWFMDYQIKQLPRYVQYLRHDDIS